MPALATKSRLSDYSRLPISNYQAKLKQSDAADVEVSYTYKGKSHSYRIKVSKTIPHYGGSRYWWSCPKCSNRAAVLYCAGKYVCRRCVGANYKTQLIQPLDRLFERVAGVRARLGWQQGIAHGHGLKPRYMHQRTYNRLVNEHDQLTQKIIRAMT